MMGKTIFYESIRLPKKLNYNYIHQKCNFLGRFFTKEIFWYIEGILFIFRHNVREILEGLNYSNSTNSVTVLAVKLRTIFFYNSIQWKKPEDVMVWLKVNNNSLVLDVFWAQKPVYGTVARTS